MTPQASKRRCVGFPIVFGVEHSVASGLVQTVAPTVLDRSFAAGVDIELRLNHDEKKVVARTGDDSLKLTVVVGGVMADAWLDPTTAAGAELSAALDAGTIAGGSYGWRPIWNRWTVSGDPVRCEVRAALVHEVSVVIKPHVPRFVGTWAGGLRGDRRTGGRSSNGTVSGSASSSPQVIPALPISS
jgi:HK97 family phage prohead protease